MNPYAIIGALLSAIALAVGGYFYGRHVEALAFDAYKSQQAALAAQQVAANTKAVAAQAAAEAAGLRAINDTLQEQTDGLTKARDAALADRDQLARRLQQYVARASQRAAAVPAARTGAGQRDEASDSALSVGFQSLTEWIGGELFDADQLAVQLTAAQAVIAQDRQICNGAVPGLTPAR